MFLDQEYNDRVEKIFNRLNTIQSNVEGEKQHRFKELDGILQNFEKKLKDISDSKAEKYEFMQGRLKDLKANLDLEIENRGRMEKNLFQEMQNLEKNCNNIFDEHIKDRTTQDRKLMTKISQDIDSIRMDVNKENQLLQNKPHYLEVYINEDIPRLRDQVENEVALRKEIEDRIYEQFMEQINELHESCEQERKQRESTEEELISILKNIASNVQENILTCKKEREKNEELLIKLVEQVIQKLKQETLESEY